MGKSVLKLCQAIFLKRELKCASNDVLNGVCLQLIDEVEHHEPIQSKNILEI